MASPSAVRLASLSSVSRFPFNSETAHNKTVPGSYRVQLYIKKRCCRVSHIQLFELSISNILGRHLNISQKFCSSSQNPLDG